MKTVFKAPSGVLKNKRPNYKMIIYFFLNMLGLTLIPLNYVIGVSELVLVFCGFNQLKLSFPFKKITIPVKIGKLV